MSNDNHNIYQKFQYDFDNFLKPYYEKIKYTWSQEFVDQSFELWKNAFVDQKCELVEYENFDWVDTFKHVKTIKYGNVPHRYLGYTDINFFRALEDPDPRVYRRVRQVVELACDLVYNDQVNYPCDINNHQMLHPGNTMLHAHMMLKKPCKILRVTSKDFVEDGGKVLQTFHCMADIQKIIPYPLRGTFIDLEPHYNPNHDLGDQGRLGMQTWVEWGNFNYYTKHGDLGYVSDLKPWPLDRWLRKFSSLTRFYPGDKIKVQMKLTGIDSHIFEPFELNIPHKNGYDILLKAFKWGNQFCKI